MRAAPPHRYASIIVVSWGYVPLLDPGYASIIVVSWGYVPLLDPGYASIIVVSTAHAACHGPEA
jgi:hypothetical protein